MNINNIASAGSNLANKDFNKAACFNAFKHALDNDGQFSSDDMAKLYRYFMPATPAKPKTDFQWIAQAMGNKDIRYYLNYVYSDGVRLMATDGHRLHLIKEANMPAGYYDKAGNMVEGVEFAKFPDIDRIIPKTTADIHFNCLSPIADLDGAKEFGEVYLFAELKICSKYLKQACQYFDNALIGFSDKNTAVLIQDSDKLAVVMPMRK